MEEQRKRKVRSKSKRPGKAAIIAFRLELDLSQKLSEHVHVVPIKGICSNGDMARKIVMDFLQGRLVYLSPQHRSLNPAQTDPVTSA